MRVFQVISQAEELQRLDGVPSHVLGARSSHMLLWSNLEPFSLTTTDRNRVGPLQLLTTHCFTHQFRCLGVWGMGLRIWDSQLCTARGCHCRTSTTEVVLSFVTLGASVRALSPPRFATTSSVLGLPLIFDCKDSSPWRTSQV